jgi:hypothetical protein
MLPADVYVVPMLRMFGAIPLLPYTLNGVQRYSLNLHYSQEQVGLEFCPEVTSLQLQKL